MRSGKDGRKYTAMKKLTTDELRKLVGKEVRVFHLDENRQPLNSCKMVVGHEKVIQPGCQMYYRFEKMGSLLALRLILWRCNDEKMD